MADFPTEQQELKDGVGPVFHRVYRIALPVGEIAARRAMKNLQADINAFSPQWLARFEKNDGAAGPLKEGDCFQIYLSGPWNAPVRVHSVAPSEFCLITLEGHLEAGEIHFKLENEGGQIYFTVESLARSKDKLVDLVYDKIPVARLAQTQMWEMFCQAFAEEALRLERGAREGGAEEPPPVETFTEKMDEKTGEWKRA